jgi:hypothetical protein
MRIPSNAAACGHGPETSLNGATRGTNQTATGVRLAQPFPSWRFPPPARLQGIAEPNSGMIWVNSENVRHLPTPFGGVKGSGIGRDGGDWSFDFYMETKNVAFAMGKHAIQKLGR